MRGIGIRVGQFARGAEPAASKKLDLEQPLIRSRKLQRASVRASLPQQILNPEAQHLVQGLAGDLLMQAAS